MGSDAKEVVGFISRWILLLLASAANIGSAVVSVIGTSLVLSEAPARMALPDRTAQVGEKLCWIGHTNVSVPVRAPMGTYVAPKGGPLRYAVSYGDRFRLFIPSGEQTRSEVRLRGFPYSRFAFRRQSAMLLRKVGREGLIVLDARLVLSESPARGADLLRLAGDKPVALLVIGSVDKFVSARATLRPWFPDVPILLVTDEGGEPAPEVHRLLRRLGWQSNGRPWFVTEDGALARELAPRLGPPACVLLLSPDGSSLPRRPELTVVRDWDSLMDLLRGSAL